MKLTYHDIKGVLFQHELEQPLVRLGRDPSMDLSLIDPTVSNVHASISKFNGYYYLTDLHSTNGTKLNGSLIGKSILNPGDHIQLGEFSIWFELPKSQAPHPKIIDFQVFTKKSVGSLDT